MEEIDSQTALRGVDRIAAQLESMKQGGHISEYLLSWRGIGGRLDPNVTVWSEPQGGELEQALARALAGLVPRESIQILAEGDAVEA